MASWIRKVSRWLSEEHTTTSTLSRGEEGDISLVFRPSALRDYCDKVELPSLGVAAASVYRAAQSHVCFCWNAESSFCLCSAEAGGAARSVSLPPRFAAEISGSAGSCVSEHVGHSREEPRRHPESSAGYPGNSCAPFLQLAERTPCS
ncbi:unnamed protein product [Gadus morhua 'NCC']